MFVCFVFVFKNINVFCVCVLYFVFCVLCFALLCLLVCLCVCGRCVILPLIITADLLDHQMIINTAVAWQA